MDREAWRAAIHRVTKSWTWLSNWTELRAPEIYSLSKFLALLTLVILLCIVSPFFLIPYNCNFVPSNQWLEEAQAGIKIAGRNINNLRHADDTTLTAESEEELKSLLMKVKEESEKVRLKLNIQKMKIMASGPITSWEIDGETVSDFIYVGSKITADGDAAMKLKDTYSLEGKLWPT